MSNLLASDLFLSSESEAESTAPAPAPVPAPEEKKMKRKSSKPTDGSAPKKSKTKISSISQPARLTARELFGDESDEDETPSCSKTGGNPNPMPQQPQQPQPQGLIVETGNGASVLPLPATTLEQIRHIAADPGASTLRLPPAATDTPVGARELDFDLCYVCKHCKVAFPSPTPLQNHQSRSCYVGRESSRGVIRVVQPALECRACPGERFRTAAEFRRHADTEAHMRHAAPPPLLPGPPEPLAHEMEDVVNQITLLAARAAQDAPKDSNANFCVPSPRFPPPGELPLASAGH